MTHGRKHSLSSSSVRVRSCDLGEIDLLTCNGGHQATTKLARCSHKTCELLPSEEQAASRASRGKRASPRPLRHLFCPLHRSSLAALTSAAARPIFPWAPADRSRPRDTSMRTTSASRPLALAAHRRSSVGRRPRSTLRTRSIRAAEEHSVWQEVPGTFPLDHHSEKDLLQAAPLVNAASSTRLLLGRSRLRRSRFRAHRASRFCRRMRLDTRAKQSSLSVTMPTSVLPTRTKVGSRSLASWPMSWANSV